MPYIPELKIDNDVYKVKDAELRDEVSDLKSVLSVSSVLYDYGSDALINDGYIDGGGTIYSIPSASWKYSDAIEIPTNIKGKSRYFLIKAQLQRNATSLVSGVAFYQGTKSIFRNIYIDHNTENVGEVCTLIAPIPNEATHFRLCSNWPTVINFFACIIDGKECISDDSLETVTNGIFLNALKYAGTQNGFINANGVFTASANNGWTTSDYIDVTHYNTVRCQLKGMNITSVLALYDENKAFIRGITADASGNNYAFVTGDYDISEACYLRICFHLTQVNELDKPVACTLYNRSNPQKTSETRVNIQHTVNKPYIFSGKTAVFCGDSITRGFTSGSTTTENGYPKVFSDSVGMTFTNKGVGGASIARVSGFGCIQDQVTSISNPETVDYIFIAGGVNDWQLGVSLSDFRTAVTDMCAWLSSNYNHEVIFILPINEAGWTPVRTPVAELEEYRKILEEIALKYEYSIVNGELFNFPTKDAPTTFINDMFGDRLHPSEKGYRLYAKMLKTVLQ